MVSNILYFHPCSGEISTLTDFFQMGWNHQPIISLYIYIIRIPIKQPITTTTFFFNWLSWLDVWTSIWFFQSLFKEKNWKRRWFITFSSCYSTNTWKSMRIICYHPLFWLYSIVFFSHGSFSICCCFPLELWEGHGINEATAAAGGLWIAWGNWSSGERIDSYPTKGERENHGLDFVLLERGYS